MTRTPTPAANTHAAAPVVRIPDERLARIFRDEETRRAIEARLNADAHLQKLRHRVIRPSLIDRVSDALSSPRFLLFYAGFYAGCMATVGLAFVWSLFL